MNNKVSISHTALIWTGIILCLIGAIVAISGLGGLTSLEVSFNAIKIKTTSVGLGILVIGALLSGVVAIKLPKGIITLGVEHKYSLTEILARRIPMFSLIIGIVAAILLLLSVLNRE